MGVVTAVGVLPHRWHPVVGDAISVGVRVIDVPVARPSLRAGREVVEPGPSHDPPQAIIARESWVPKFAWVSGSTVSVLRYTWNRKSLRPHQLIRKTV